MPDLAAPIEIPNRALFKASEVCDLLKVQSYVLRSWEAEFPSLGVAQASGGPRVYRRVDVEQVIKIRHLLLVEGLTLAGARRKLEDEAPPVIDIPALDAATAKKARERIGAVKRGLRSLLDLLGEPARAGALAATPPEALELELTPPDEPRRRERPAPASNSRGKTVVSPPAKAARPSGGRVTATPSRSSSPPGRSPRRKRSA
jgi:DNA-binding transcriptional MerR regulator